MTAGAGAKTTGAGAGGAQQTGAGGGQTGAGGGQQTGAATGAGQQTGAAATTGAGQQLVTGAGAAQNDCTGAGAGQQLCTGAAGRHDETGAEQRLAAIAGRQLEAHDLPPRSLENSPQLFFWGLHPLRNSCASEVSIELKVVSENAIANVSAAIHPEFRFMGLPRR